MRWIHSVSLCLRVLVVLVSPPVTGVVIVISSSLVYGRPAVPVVLAALAIMPAVLVVCSALPVLPVPVVRAVPAMRVCLLCLLCLPCLMRLLQTLCFTGLPCYDYIIMCSLCVVCALHAMLCLVCVVCSLCLLFFLWCSFFTGDPSPSLPLPPGDQQCGLGAAPLFPLRVELRHGAERAAEVRPRCHGEGYMMMLMMIMMMIIIVDNIGVVTLGVILEIYGRIHPRSGGLPARNTRTAVLTPILRSILLVYTATSYGWSTTRRCMVQDKLR